MARFLQYISTYNLPVFAKIKGEPIEVGAARRNEFLYELRDDSGDNISLQNPYYAELTGLYWIWKNVVCEPDDIISFCHYNKCLWITPQKATKKLQNGYEIIVAHHQAIPSNEEDDFIVLKEVLKELDVKAYEAYCKLYDDFGAGRRCNAKNMFIATKRELDAYCEFLFPILAECRERIGDAKDRFSRRYLSYLAERLLTVYLLTYDKKYYETDILYSEKKLTVGKFVLNRLSLNPDGRFLVFFRNRFKHGSFQSHDFREDD